MKPDWKESRTDAFYERLTVRAATIDELLSDDFEPLPGQKEDADRAARRLAAWCRSCASGDWSLFGRRLERDGLTLAQVLARFATVRRKASASPPAWVDDAIWIEAALQRPARDGKPLTALAPGEPCAFEQLFTPLVEQAGELLWAGIDARASRQPQRSRPRLPLACASQGAVRPVRRGALRALRQGAEGRCVPRPTRPRRGPAPAARYDRFVAEMKAGGFRRLFEDKPVLLRLIAGVTRQWIDTSRELVLRLDADLGGDPAGYPPVRRRQPGRRDRRRSLRPAQWRPFGPDRQLRGRRRASSTSRRICGSMSLGTT